MQMAWMHMRRGKGEEDTFIIQSFLFATWSLMQIPGEREERVEIWRQMREWRRRSNERGIKRQKTRPFPHISFLKMRKRISPHGRMSSDFAFSSQCCSHMWEKVAVENKMKKIILVIPLYYFLCENKGNNIVWEMDDFGLRRILFKRGGLRVFGGRADPKIFYYHTAARIAWYRQCSRKPSCAN